MFKASLPRLIFGFTACAASLGMPPAWSDIRLPNVLSDGMVLQRDAPIRVWGWAGAGEHVQVHFRGATTAARADKKGQWSILLGPFPAGGPFEMHLAGKNTLTLRDILIGDVWVASGQSNMEYPVGQVIDADAELARAQFPNVRLFQVSEASAVSAQSDVASTGWRPVTPDNVRRFSAVAYFFARHLHQRYQVPIGLIQATWGGTAAEAWMSRSALSRFHEFASTIAQTKDQATFERILQKQNAWYEKHGDEDRGRSNGIDRWADPTFDSGNWPSIDIPRPRAQLSTDFDGFAGVVWYRKEVTIPADNADRDLTLNLGKIVEHDIAYFNGQQVGTTRGGDIARLYFIPRALVRPGRNVIAIRVTGRLNFSSIGIYGDAEQISLRGCGVHLGLAGSWSFQTGADFRSFPKMDPILATRYRANPAPATLFNGMIHPLTPYRVKGVIWYQGEHNAGYQQDENDEQRRPVLFQRTTLYRTLFPRLIEDWRRHWDQALPFMFVQIAGYGPNKPEPADYPWAELREAQSMALSLPQTGMATAIDLGDEKDIHPKNKADVARRLALAALRSVYGEEVVSSGPTYRAMRIEGSRIRIQYDGIGSGLLIGDKYGYARGFEVAGADGTFVWAHAEQDGQDIIVFNKEIPLPRAVRYAWSNSPDGNLYNREGLPALPFRTDAPEELLEILRSQRTTE